MLAKKSMESKLFNLDIKMRGDDVYFVAASNVGSGKDMAQVLLGAGLALKHTDSEKEDLH